MRAKTSSRTPVASLRTLLLQACLAVSAFLFLAAGNAAAATITVDTLDDELNIDADCSLREAITAANSNTAVDACVAGSSADTIEFTASGTIVLTSSLPTIQGQLTIAGPGAASLTISGNNSVGVLSVGLFVVVELKDLTVADGNAALGGGIENSGTLTVRHCTFTGNRASVWGGAIRNANRLTVFDSTFSGNGTSGTLGGAIANMGFTATIARSTFANNLASGGGAIFNSHSPVRVDITDSTFTGNTANGGGAIDQRGIMTVERSTFSSNRALTASGGAILDTGSFSTTTITNSTFSGNNANFGGAVANNNSHTMTVSHSTFSGNVALVGGATATFFATTTVRNSLVAHNAGGNCYRDSTRGTIVDGGGNLSYPDTTCPGINLDPVLAPLADNGGPTETHALGAGSAAIDAVFANCAAVDQRGVSRPFGLRCDIGAYESDNLSPVADAGADLVVSASADCTADVTLDGSFSSDPDGDPLTYAWSGPVVASGPSPTVTLPRGVHVLTLTVSDGKGGSDTDEVEVTVADTTPPRIDSLTATPNVLWPPDHKMVPVSIAASADDACGLAACQIDSIASNEPASDPDGDWQVTGPLSLELRAERLGSGSGRVYAITVRCSDTLANASTGTVTVTVPKSQGGNK